MLKPVPYSFAENESENGTAIINFNKNSVELLDFEGANLPKPETRTYWSPIIFPAGRPFTLKLHIFYKSNTSLPSVGTWSSSGTALDLIALASLAGEIGKSVDRNIIFNCPALEAGREYEIIFVSHALLKDYFLLRDKKTRKKVYEVKFKA